MTSFNNRARNEASKYQHQISPKARHKFTFDCGANKDGGGGFQSGNTCGGGGDGKKSSAPISKAKARTALNKAMKQAEKDDNEVAIEILEHFRMPFDDFNPEDIGIELSSMDKKALEFIPKVVLDKYKPHMISRKKALDIINEHYSPYSKTGKKRTFATDCGANKDGGGGFQPGNSCGGDGDGKNTSGDQGGGDQPSEEEMGLHLQATELLDEAVDMGAVDDDTMTKYDEMIDDGDYEKAMREVDNIIDDFMGEMPDDGDEGGGDKASTSVSEDTKGAAEGIKQAAQNYMDQFDPSDMDDEDASMIAADVAQLNDLAEAVETGEWSRATKLFGDMDTAAKEELPDQVHDHLSDLLMDSDVQPDLDDAASESQGEIAGGLGPVTIDMAIARAQSGDIGGFGEHYWGGGHSGGLSDDEQLAVDMAMTEEMNPLLGEYQLSGVFDNALLDENALKKHNIHPDDNGDILESIVNNLEAAEFENAQKWIDAGADHLESTVSKEAGDDFEKKIRTKVIETYQETLDDMQDD